MSQEDLEKLLKRLPSDEYPPELKTARKGEFIAEIHGEKTKRKVKKPGCPFAVLSVLLSLVAIAYGVYFAYTHILLAVMEGFMWVFRYSV
jgi:hypothetical protein